MSFCGNCFWLDFPKSYMRFHSQEVEDSCSTMGYTYSRNGKIVGKNTFSTNVTQEAILYISQLNVIVYHEKCVHAILCALFQELLVLCSGQPEPAAAVGLVQTQAGHPAGTHVFPLQPQTLHV